MEGIRHLRPMQTLSPEVRDKERRPGEVVFPDGFVLPPGEPFTAIIVKVEIVWNEFLPREMGGGFIRQSDKRFQTANELVETGILIIDTDHGRAAIAYIKNQLKMLKAMLMEQSMIGVPLRFQLDKITIRNSAGDQIARAWVWKMPGALT